MRQAGCGDRQHRHPGGRRVAAQPAQHLAAVHARHADVGEHQIEGLPGTGLQGSLPVLGGDHLTADAPQGGGEQLAAVGIVLHHQHPSRRGGVQPLDGTGSSTCSGVGPPASSQRGQFQGHIEAAALVRHAAQLHFPPHGLHEAAGQHQPQTGTALAATRTALTEGGEDVRLLRLGNSRPLIAYRQEELGPVSPGLEFDFAVCGELDGIAQQVADDLAELDAVGVAAFTRLQVQLRLQCQPLELGLRREQGQQLLQLAAGLEHLVVHLQAAGFDLGQVEHIVDQPQQALASLQDGRHALSQQGGQVPLLQHQLGVSQHCVQRRADLVAHVGQEHTLGLVGGVGLFPCFAQAQLQPAALGQVGDGVGKVLGSTPGVLEHEERGQDPMAATAPAVRHLELAAPVLTAQHRREHLGFDARPGRVRVVVQEVALPVLLPVGFPHLQPHARVHVDHPAVQAGHAHALTGAVHQPAKQSQRLLRTAALFHLAAQVHIGLGQLGGALGHLRLQAGAGLAGLELPLTASQQVGRQQRRETQAHRPGRQIQPESCRAKTTRRAQPQVPMPIGQPDRDAFMPSTLPGPQLPALHPGVGVTELTAVPRQPSRPGHGRIPQQPLQPFGAGLRSSRLGEQRQIDGGGHQAPNREVRADLRRLRLPGPHPQVVHRREQLHRQATPRPVNLLHKRQRSTHLPILRRMGHRAGTPGVHRQVQPDQVLLGPLRLQPAPRKVLAAGHGHRGGPAGTLLADAALAGAGSAEHPLEGLALLQRHPRQPGKTQQPGSTAQHRPGDGGKLLRVDLHLVELGMQDLQVPCSQVQVLLQRGTERLGLAAKLRFSSHLSQVIDRMAAHQRQAQPDAQDRKGQPGHRVMPHARMQPQQQRWGDQQHAGDLAHQGVDAGLQPKGPRGLANHPLLWPPCGPLHDHRGEQRRRQHPHQGAQRLAHWRRGNQTGQTLQPARGQPGAQQGSDVAKPGSGQPAGGRAPFLQRQPVRKPRSQQGTQQQRRCRPPAKHHPGGQGHTGRGRPQDDTVGRPGH